MTLSAESGPAGPGTVSVVVVNWNGRDLLEGCLSSLQRQEYDGRFEVVLVDNLSTDGSVEFVEERYPDVRVIRAPANNYAASNNLGAASSASEFVACLNTDTRVEPDWLSQLVRCARRDDRIGAVGSLILLPDGRINSTGIEPLEDFSWADRGLGEERADELSEEDVYGVSGCAVLYRRACWEEVGGLDEDFHMYFEDVDMSLRCRRRGWRVVFCPGSVVHHAYHASIDKADRTGEGQVEGFHLKDRLGERNRLLVVARHHPQLLAEVLPRSRFVLEADPAAVEQGIALALAKWEVAGLDRSLREQLLVLMMSARGVILERESWARASDWDVSRRDEKIRELVRHSEELIAAHEVDRRSLAGRLERAERKLDEAERARDRALEEVRRLEREMAEVHRGYEDQIAKDRRELESVRGAYEAEISHREDVIAALRRRLDEMEAEREGRRKGSPAQ